MNTLNISEASKILRKSVKTLQRWDRDKTLIAFRTQTNRRYYTEEQLNYFLNIQTNPVPQKVVVYLRVSSQAQKPDLKNQRTIMESFCVSSGLANVEFVEEVGSGLNFKRIKFLRVIKEISEKKISKLIIAHKDRLCRFGYELIEWFCKENCCEVLVLNQEKLSPEQEMVQDLMTIIHCFSSRLYGLRNYKKFLQKALKNESSTQN